MIANHQIGHQQVFPFTRSLNFMGTIQAIGKDSRSSFLHAYYTHHCINHPSCNSLEKLSHTKLMIHKHFQFNTSLGDCCSLFLLEHTCCHHCDDDVT